MRFQVVFLLILLCVLSVLLNAQELPNHYVWNREGVVVYSTPSASTVIDTLQYGSVIHIIEVGEGVEIPLFRYPSDTISHVYNFSSRWLYIEFSDGQRGYAPNTYLLPYSPTTTEVMNNYFGQLSDLTDQRSVGQTEQFCSQMSYVYKNGIRYIYTDLGPCEACGQSLTEIILPEWTLQQAFVFITNFNSQLWDLDGIPVKNYLEQVTFTEVKQNYPTRFQWEYVYDMVTLTETENGVEIRIDTVL